MEMPRALANIIEFARTVNSYQNYTMSTLSAMIITPDNEQIELIMPKGMSRFSMYALNRSDDLRIKGQLQPGVYMNKVLKNKDNLYLEITERQGLTQVTQKYRATPKGDANPQMEGNSVKLANMDAKDFLNIVEVEFQLMEPGYAILKNRIITDKHLMSTVRDALQYQLIKFGKELQLIGADAWRGVDIEEPVDNTRIFPVIDISPPIPLKDLGQWLQDNDQFGFYSKGFGMYYRKGMWYIFPLFKMGRYETARKVLNIYRIPQDVIPTLEVTHFTEGKVTTILSTGEAKHLDGSDIVKQNKGTGKRIVSPDAVMGETGGYYNKGVHLSTRADTLSEYKTSNRGSGEDAAPFSAEPTNNLAKHLSANAFTEGNTETIQWMNSDHSKLEPGMPVRFFFLTGDVLSYKEGTLLGARTEHVRDQQTPNDLKFRQSTALSLFLNDQIVEVT